MSLKGSWKYIACLGTSEYRHEFTVESETDTTFSGTWRYPAGGPYTITWTFTGTKSGTVTTITMHIDYDSSSYCADLMGTIDTTGEIEGTWTDSNGKSGAWKTYEGAAIHQGDVGTGWPGLFTSTIPPFTFTTDEYGAGSWHINLRNSDFPGPGIYTLSVWINEAGATILISDNFDVVVE